jgi:hypothetical protein
MRFLVQEWIISGTSKRLRAEAFFIAGVRDVLQEIKTQGSPSMVRAIVYYFLQNA